MSVEREGYELVAEIPAEEGKVTICEFRGRILVCPENGPARVIQRKADGSYEMIVINASLKPPSQEP